jgi:hypothetical protein
MKKTLTESRFQFLAGVINEKQYLAEAMTGYQFAKGFNLKFSQFR